MAQLNRFQAIGNLGKEPDLQVTPDGTPFLKFNVAVTSGFGTKEETLWVHTVCYRKLAEDMSRFLGKGTKIFFEGRMQMRSFNDKDGNQREWWEVIANNVQVLGSYRKDEPLEGEVGEEFP